MVKRKQNSISTYTRPLSWREKVCSLDVDKHLYEERCCITFDTDAVHTQRDGCHFRRMQDWESAGKLLSSFC